MKKNLLNWITTVAMVLVCVCLLSTQAKAADSGSCGNNLTWTMDTDSGVLTIEGNGEMKYYSSGQAPWITYKPYIKELIIKEGVTSISIGAFRDLTALKTVTLPASISLIKSHAFMGCTELENVHISNLTNWCKIQFETYTANPVYYASNLYLNGQPLTELVIPSGIASIGYALFANCDTLRSVVIPDGVNLIGEGSFDGCSNLTKVVMPESVTTIGKYAFSSCDALESITLPNGITSIERYAFSSCDQLKSISIPSKVTIIGEKAFYYCRSLSSVLLPTSLKLIESDAFLYCPLQHVLYKGSQAQWEEITIAQYNSAIRDAGIVYKATEGMSGEHTYNWTTVDESYHEQICTLCNKKTTGSHRWDSGLVTEQPTCKKAGIKTFTCKVCNGIKTEGIDRVKYHTYDNNCDAECNACGNTRNVSHQYGTGWIITETNHWYECHICGKKENLGIHTPGAAATETSAQTCTTCSYIINPALNHTHNYSNVLTNNHEGHWYACSGCSEQKGYATHTPNATATETTAQICTVCGYVITPALSGGSNSTESVAPTKYTEPIKPTQATKPTQSGIVAPTESKNTTKSTESMNSTQSSTVASTGSAEPTQNTESIDPTQATESTTQANTTAPTDSQQPTTSEKKGGASWVIPVVIVVIIGGASAAFLVWKKKKIL